MLVNNSLLSDEISNHNNTTIYKLRERIYKTIPSEYFSENFKIKKDFFLMCRQEIEYLIKEVKKILLKQIFLKLSSL